MMHVITLYNLYKVKHWFSDRLSVDFDKNIIGIGKTQNSHISTPLAL